MAGKSAGYWKSRFESLEKSQYNRGMECYEELERQYRKAEKEIEGQISSWYQRFADNNEISLTEARRMLNSKELAEFKWDVNDYIKYGEENAMNGQWMKQLENASARYHVSRLESLEVQMQQQIETLFGNQLDSIDATMKDVYTEGYYHTAYEIQKGAGVGWDFATLDTRTIDKVINKPWAADGKNFSERIWNNREKLVNELNQTLVQNIILGQDPQKAINAIADKLNVSKRSAGRLVMTEEAYFSSEAQKDCFNELDVEQYEIVATLDSHTSEICQEMDGKVFPMSQWEVGATAPPFHPWCRSTTVPAFGDEFDNIGTRAARDEETGKTYQVPGNCTYDKWEKAFVEGDKSVLQEITDNAKISTSVPEKIQFVEAKTIKEAEAFAHDVCGIETVSYKGCDIKVANAMNESLTNALNYCPELKNNINFYGSAQERNKLMKADLADYYLDYYRDFFKRYGYTGEALEKYANECAKKAALQVVGKVSGNTYAIAYSGKFAGTVAQEIQAIGTKYRGISVNTAMAKSYEYMLANVKADVSVKFHPVGTDSVRSVFDHEFGHQLDYLYGLRDDQDIQKMFYTGYTSSEIKNSLSQYGAKNIAEFIAEGYSEYVNNSNPREIAETIGSIIEGKVNK